MARIASNAQEMSFQTLDEDFWAKYFKGRPTPPQSFWDRIVAYHTSYGNGTFDQVNDLGGGPGIHSAALAKLFRNVTVTDPGPENIDAARRYLDTVEPDSGRFTCRIGRAEDKLEGDAGRFDMVFMANALHWTDVTDALEAIASSLKTGGTFIVPSFVLPTFYNRVPIAKASQLLDHSGLAMTESGKWGGWQQLVTMYDTGCDSVNLDRRQWKNVKRLRLNFGMNEGMNGQKTLSPTTPHYKYSRESHDDCSSEIDETWSVKMNFEHFKDTMKTIPLAGDPDFMAKTWREIEAEFNGGELEGRIPVALVMATKV